MKELYQLEKASVFKETYYILAAIAIFCCSSARCEVSFSTMNRILTSYRRSMSFFRESSLTLLVFEKKTMEEISRKNFFFTNVTVQKNDDCNFLKTKEINQTYVYTLYFTYYYNDFLSSPYFFVLLFPIMMLVVIKIEKSETLLLACSLVRKPTLNLTCKIKIENIN